MRALVTGASGVVGANLVRELLDAGWRVRVLQRPGPPRRALVGLPIEVAPGDVLDEPSVATAMADTDVVFHAAARFAYGGVDAAERDAVAVQGTRAVVRAAAAAGVGRVVLTASSVVFGSSSRPEPRDEDAPFTPDDASAYAASKLRQERVARHTARVTGVDLVSVHPTLTVGPFDYRLAQSHAALVRYLNDPWRTTFPGGCNVVAARDVARGHRLVAEAGESGAAYLLAGTNLSWRALHETVAGLCDTWGPLVTASHTGAWLAAVASEATARLTGTPPALTRDEARMVGRWYWYDDRRARGLGHAPASAEDALAEALRWLLRTHHVRDDVRASLTVPHRRSAATAAEGSAIPELRLSRLPDRAPSP